MADLPGSLRAFIAVNLPPELKSALGALQQALQSEPGGRAVRWTPAAQIHLTLRFLGDVPADAVPEIQAAVQRACPAAPPFELHAGGLGCFPGPRQPRIIWVGITGALEWLRQLHFEVERETAAWGDPEDRQFHPHLTIGRVRKEHARSVRQLASALSDRGDRPLGSWRVTHVDLMQSHLAPSGAEYSCLASLPLAG